MMDTHSLKYVFSRCDKATLSILRTVCKQFRSLIPPIKQINLIRCAIWNDSPSLLTYAQKLGYPVHDDLYELAIKRKSLKCLQYLHKCGYSWDDHVYKTAAKLNSIECFSYFYKSGSITEFMACKFAIKADSVDCLRYIHENITKITDTELRYSIEKNAINCLSYIVSAKLVNLAEIMEVILCRKSSYLLNVVICALGDKFKNQHKEFFINLMARAAANQLIKWVLIIQYYLNCTPSQKIVNDIINTRGTNIVIQASSNSIPTKVLVGAIAGNDRTIIKYCYLCSNNKWPSEHDVNEFMQISNKYRKKQIMNRILQGPEAFTN